jgi:hypothetical protein
MPSSLPNHPHTVGQRHSDLGLAAALRQLTTCFDRVSQMKHPSVMVVALSRRRASGNKDRVFSGHLGPIGDARSNVFRGQLRILLEKVIDAHSPSEIV